AAGGLFAAGRRQFEELSDGCDRRNHVVPAVLLLRLGRGEYSAEPVVRELDAAHERIRSVWRTGRTGVRRMGQSREGSDRNSVGGDGHYYRRGEPGGIGDGDVKGISGQAAGRDRVDGTIDLIGPTLSSFRS